MRFANYSDSLYIMTKEDLTGQQSRKGVVFARLALFVTAL